MPDVVVKYPILTDRPASQDGLDFQPYIDSLAELMIDPATSTPLTIGVFGRWGSGKTSLMELIKRQVAGKGYKTVWFNAWKYERESLALWRVLILRTLDALRPRQADGEPYKIEELADSGQKELVRELDRLEQSVYRTVEWTELGKWTVDWAKALEGTVEGAAEIALSLVPGAAPLVNLLNQARKAVKGKDAAPIVEAFQREAQTFRREQLRSIEQFIDGFEQTVQRHVTARGERLVVFIDDLDRCLPERTVEVLEAIKLFLDVPGCIFILGVDPSKVRHGIQLRYQGSLSAEEGTDYLEKIIQVPFILPTIDAKDMHAFIAGLQVDFPRPGCIDIFARTMEPNPRQIKRVINIFLLLWKLVGRRRLDLTALCLAKVVVIQHRYAELYELLKLMPRYLADLEIHYLRQQEAQEAKRAFSPGEAEAKKSSLPAPLEAFAERASLRDLFTLFAGDEEASFRYLTPTQLRSYITLAGRAETERRSQPTTSRPAFEPEMVQVPAGEFIMGSTEEEVKQRIADKDETPQHKVNLPAYEIGRYPVTNLEYKAFVDITGYRPPKHWDGGQFPDKLADHPVVHVSWSDAVAYCKWLSETNDKLYRLPTEAEWERAARGADGRRYPWGNEWSDGLANTEEAGIGTTTPVGQYSPAGDSPVGCADMVGNVWEWCSTMWNEQAYPFQIQDEWTEDYLNTMGHRVLRGGSFADEAKIVRGALRGRDYPYYKLNDVGFRLIRPPK